MTNGDIMKFIFPDNSSLESIGADLKILLLRAGVISPILRIKEDWVEDQVLDIEICLTIKKERVKQNMEEYCMKRCIDIWTKDFNYEKHLTKVIMKYINTKIEKQKQWNFYPKMCEKISRNPKYIRNYGKIVTMIRSHNHYNDLFDF